MPGVAQLSIIQLLREGEDRMRYKALQGGEGNNEAKNAEKKPYVIYEQSLITYWCLWRVI